MFLWSWMSVNHQSAVISCCISVRVWAADWLLLSLICLSIWTEAAALNWIINLDCCTPPRNTRSPGLSLESRLGEGAALPATSDAALCPPTEDSQTILIREGSDWDQISQGGGSGGTFRAEVYTYRGTSCEESDHWNKLSISQNLIVIFHKPTFFSLHVSLRFSQQKWGRPHWRQELLSVLNIPKWWHLNDIIVMQV